MSRAAHATYHALQLRAQQRFSHGFTLLSSFSWAKSIDNASSVRNAVGDAFAPFERERPYSLERGFPAFSSAADGPPPGFTNSPSALGSDILVVSGGRRT